MTQNPETWEQRFENGFVSRVTNSEDVFIDVANEEELSKIKSFIRTEIDRARQEENEGCAKIVWTTEKIG